MSHLNKRGLFGLLLAATVALLVNAGLLLGGTEPKAARAAPPQAQEQNQYIGVEACKACHEDMPTQGFFRHFETTPHWKTTLDTRRGPAYQGCEACHGPGAEHMNGGGDKTKIFVFNKDVNPKDISKRCLKCHEYGEEHANFARSAHNVNDISCIDCHSVHHAKQEQFLLKAKQPDLCFSCHLSVKPEFARPFRHRVNEGLIKCTDCHNQHGGFLTRSLRSTSAQDMVCFKCHADKAGPFVFEHAPVKTEGCVFCHIPHGSSNPRLLRRSQVNLLCLECHTFTTDLGVPGIPSFHNQAQKYQACTMCHTQIHGSNFSEVFFQ